MLVNPGVSSRKCRLISVYLKR